MGRRKIRVSFGKKSYLYLDIKDNLTLKTICDSVLYLLKLGEKNFTKTRLQKTAFNFKRDSIFVNERSINRVLIMMFGMKPSLLTVKQKGNATIIAPTENFFIFVDKEVKPLANVKALNDHSFRLFNSKDEPSNLPKNFPILEIHN